MPFHHGGGHVGPFAPVVLLRNEGRHVEGFGGPVPDSVQWSGWKRTESELLAFYRSGPSNMFFFKSWCQNGCLIRATLAPSLSTIHVSAAPDGAGRLEFMENGRRFSVLRLTSSGHVRILVRVVVVERYH